MRLRLWLRHGFQTFLWSLGVAAFYLLISLLSSSDATFSDIAASTPYYILIGAAMLTPIVCLSAYQSYLPAYLALGSTRRDAVTGMLLLRLVPALCTTLVSALLCLLLRADATLKLLPAAFFLILTLGAFGSISGGICQRFPKFGKTFAVIIMMLLFGVVGGCCGYLISGGLFPSLRTLSLPGLMTLLSALAAALLFGADLLLQRFTLYRYEVKL
ncbi:MAG: hypothetical protein VB055_05800 [Oscillospiraceae bacterium]|nr:hypothetical protein [Oscillospiraceae bacterium]